MKYILAIDPGPIESAWCIVDTETRVPVAFGKDKNDDMLNPSEAMSRYQPTVFAIEMIASYGMSVGATVFETCFWSGRFVQHFNLPFIKVYRKEVKIALCGSMKAKDGNIRQALIDRFGVVGTKKAPGFFFGFSGDIWSAYAVATTFLDGVKG